MPSDLLRSGTFAKLCRTTKDTLYFYEEAGLLQPRQVSANGYRGYSAAQYFEFDLITVLQDAGLSLKEIKQSLKLRDLPQLHAGVPAFDAGLAERAGVIKELVAALAVGIALYLHLAAHAVGHVGAGGEFQVLGLSRAQVVMNQYGQLHVAGRIGGAARAGQGFFRVFI